MMKITSRAIEKVEHHCHPSNEKLSEHFTLGELIRLEIAERKGIDNNPPQNLIPELKRMCEKNAGGCRSNKNTIGVKKS